MADPAADLAGALRSGVDELRAGRPAAALPHLRRVVADRELGASPELADIAARAFGLAAQAAFQLGALDDAERWASEALARARRLGDSEGIADVTELLGLVRDRRTKRDGDGDAGRRRASLDEILAVRDPVARAEALLRRCRDSLHDDDRATVLATAELVWRQAQGRGDARAQVLARLCAAHADPERAAEHLEAATGAVANGGAEVHALVTAIARTAALLGVALPVHPIGGVAT